MSAENPVQPPQGNRSKGQWLLLLCAVIWGSGFVAQRLGMRALGPFSYMLGRYILGGLCLLPLVLSQARKAARKGAPWPLKPVLLAALVCGLILFIASSLQQHGLKTTPAGRAGFLTTMYLVLVPVFGLFLGKRPRPIVWLAIAIAVVAVYLLSVTEGFTLAAGDLTVLWGAFFWAWHILAIDHFNTHVEGIAIACGQFLVCGVLAGVAALLFETPSIAQYQQGFWAVLYSGIFVVAIAFTLQVLGQRGVNPSIAALILSTEAVWAVVFGGLILHERLSPREVLGSLLMAVAVILVQLPDKKTALGREIT